MSDVKVTKTNYERCEPAGREVLRQAKEQHEYRNNWANKEIGQAAKEAATHIAGMARGRVSVMMNGDDWERIFRKGRKNAA